MNIITDTESLAALCDRLSSSPAVFLDTEFLREKTYYPGLCLIQIGNTEEAAIIDPLAGGISLEPLFDLLADPAIVKVLHAAKQDLEIFLQLMGELPKNLFDTQIAAMVCGFGESCSYAKLVQQFCKISLEKGQQFSDWARRPLSQDQLEYALADVLYLPQVYDGLLEQLEKMGRTPWIAEDMAALNNPDTYKVNLDDLWMKLKFRSSKPVYLGVLKRLVAWREEESQRRDHPRQWVLKDDAISEIAAALPRNNDELRALRGTRSGMSDSTASKIIAIIHEVLETPVAKLPSLPKPEHRPQIPTPVVDLLRTLLRHVCEEAGVASRLVAATSELEDIALGRYKNVPCLHGWRFDLFGKLAIDLVNGHLTLGAAKGKLDLVWLEDELG